MFEIQVGFGLEDDFVELPGVPKTSLSGTLKGLPSGLADSASYGGRGGHVFGTLLGHAMHCAKP